MKEWKMIESSVIAQNPWITIRKDRCITESGVEIPDYYWYSGKEFVTVLGATPDGKVPMVEQYRYGIKETTIEFPAGLIDEGEDIFEAAKRELREETGFTTEDIILEKVIFLDPGRSSKKGYQFLAKNLVKTHGQDLDSTENINIKLVDMQEISDMLKSNMLKDSNSIAIAYSALQKKEWFMEE